MLSWPKSKRVFIVALVVLFGSNFLFDQVLPAFAWTFAFAAVVLGFGISLVARKMPGRSMIVLGGLLVALGVGESAGLDIPSVVRLVVALLWFLVRPYLDKTGR